MTVNYYHCVDCRLERQKEEQAQKALQDQARWLAEQKASVDLHRRQQEQAANQLKQWAKFYKDDSQRPEGDAPF